jgi:hypothetical protein
MNIGEDDPEKMSNIPPSNRGLPIEENPGNVARLVYTFPLSLQITNHNRRKNRSERASDMTTDLIFFFTKMLISNSDASAERVMRVW